jgi:hypothetical protein
LCQKVVATVHQTPKERIRILRKTPLNPITS